MGLLLEPQAIDDLLQRIAEYLLDRRAAGKRFSIVVVAEGARSRPELQAEKKGGRRKKEAGAEARREHEAVDAIRADLPLKVRRMHREVMAYHAVQEPMASRLARQLQELTGVEARVTSLGHVLRGGTPSAFDRALCTQLGARAADLLAKGTYNVMVALRHGQCVSVPLDEVVGQRKLVPPDDPLLAGARKLGTCFGD